MLVFTMTIFKADVYGDFGCTPDSPDLNAYCNEIHFRQYCQPGATFASLKDEVLDPVLSQPPITRQSVDAVYIQVGDQNLQNYLDMDHQVGDPTWRDLLDQHVNLLSNIMRNYPENTLLFIPTAQIPLFSSEAMNLLAAYNQQLARDLVTLGPRLILLVPDEAYDLPLMMLDVLTGASEARRYALTYQEGIVFSRERQAGQRRLQSYMESKHKRRAARHGKPLRSNKKSPNPRKRVQNIYVPKKYDFPINKTSPLEGCIDINVGNGVRVAIRSSMIAAQKVRRISEKKTVTAVSIQKVPDSPKVPKSYSCFECEATFDNENAFLDHFIASHCSSASDVSLVQPRVQPLQTASATESMALQQISSESSLYGGGPQEYAVIYKNVENKHILAFDEVINILSDPEMEKISTINAVRPKAGDVYVYDADKIGKDWRADGYVWKQTGAKSIPKKNPVLKKHYFQLNNTNENGQREATTKFTRYAYEYLVKPLVLVHYNGDDAIYQPSTHGNAKNSNNDYMQTCPSVLNEIKENVKISKPIEVYQNLVTKDIPGIQQGIRNPRNHKQVYNAKERVDRNTRLSRDDVSNLVEQCMHVEEGNYTKSFIVYPDVVCVFIYDKLADELNTILRLKTHPPVSLFYDTTFNVGDYYVSTLLFNHAMFNKGDGPSIPIGFMVHERKLTRHHEHFFRDISEAIPYLSKSSCAFITDREPGITKAFETVFPTVNVVHCWNHIKTDCRFHLINNTNADKTKDVPTYVDHIQKLLQSESEECFHENYENIRKDWSGPWREYVDKNIKPCIEKYSGRWIIEKLGIYHPDSGITNNRSESINSVLHALHKWRRTPIDCIMLIFWHTQRYYYLEICRGRAGVGKYSLKPEYADYKIEKEEIPRFSKIVSPSNVVDYIRNGKLNEADQNITANKENNVRDETTLPDVPKSSIHMSPDDVTEGRAETSEQNCEDQNISANNENNVRETTLLYCT